MVTWVICIFARLKGKKYSTQIDLASRFHQVSIIQKNRHESAFRDAQGWLFEFSRAVCGLAILCTTFTGVVKRTIETTYSDVVSWLDDILISSYTWVETLMTLSAVLTELSNTNLSVDSVKCLFGSPVSAVFVHDH